MYRYVTVQEYGKHLTSVAELPLIVLVVTVTVLLPSMNIPPPCKGEDAFSSFIALHWGDGLFRNGSRILGKRLTPVAVLPLMVQTMAVTVLLPSIAMPPPCEGEDEFSGFTTLQRGDGLLRNSKRFECCPIAHCLPEQDTQQ